MNPTSRLKYVRRKGHGYSLKISGKYREMALDGDGVHEMSLDALCWPSPFDPGSTVRVQMARIIQHL